MLSMLKRHEIQTLARAKHSYDEIAELTGVPRRTVARVIQEEPVTEIDDDSERRRRGIGRPSKVEPFRELVRKVLEGEPRLLSVEIFRRVKLKGYRGQKSAMYAMIHELRPTQSDLVTRFEGLPGEFTQHDFGEVKVRYLDGTVEKVLFFASRLKYSRWAQVSVVPNQKAETLVRTTCEHFASLGGIPLMAGRAHLYFLVGDRSTRRSSANASGNGIHPVSSRSSMPASGGRPRRKLSHFSRSLTTWYWRGSEERSRSG